MQQGRADDNRYPTGLEFGHKHALYAKSSKTPLARCPMLHLRFSLRRGADRPVYLFGFAYECHLLLFRVEVTIDRRGLEQRRTVQIWQNRKYITVDATTDSVDSPWHKQWSGPVVDIRVRYVPPDFKTTWLHWLDVSSGDLSERYRLPLDHRFQSVSAHWFGAIGNLVKVHYRVSWVYVEWLSKARALALSERGSIEGVCPCLQWLLCVAPLWAFARVVEMLRVFVPMGGF